LTLVECRLKTRAPDVKIVTVLVIIGKTYIEENWGWRFVDSQRIRPELIRRTGQHARRITCIRVQKLLKLIDICYFYSVQKKFTLNSVLFIVKKKH
jgi:hypothetical protein